MEIIYEGPTPLASAVAQALGQHGVEVVYEPPLESRGAGEVAGAVVTFVVLKVVDGLTDSAVDAAIKAVAAKFGGRIKSLRRRP